MAVLVLFSLAPPLLEPVLDPEGKPYFVALLSGDTSKQRLGIH